MNWDNVSDFEINKAVAEKLGLKMCEGQHYQPCVSHWVDGSLTMFNPCNSWADMGQLIHANGISIIKWPSEVLYEASFVSYYGHGAIDQDLCCTHENPLRAAAIAFLMKNNVKPEDI